MSSTICIYNKGKAECTGKQNSHIDNLICARHLKEYHHLQIRNGYLDTTLNIYFAPWVLSPIPGMHFKRNDVILPVQEFFDKTYRPSQLPMPEDEKIYRINTRMDEFIRQVLSSGRLNNSDRITYEMIRNLSQPTEKTILNPTKECENDPKPLAYINSKMAVSKTFIQKHSIVNYIEGLEILDLKTRKIDKLNDKKYDLSLAYRYIISKCEFQSHIVANNATDNLELTRLVPNAGFHPGVGLIAMTNISDPEPIVVAGHAHGNNGGEAKDYRYYDELVLTQPKEVYTQKTPYRLPTQSYTRKAFTTSCI